MKAIVHVSLKQGVLDPQGKAIASALKSQGFDAVGEVRQGKYFELELSADISREQAEEMVSRMCDALLANTVIEDYRFEIMK